MALTSFFTSSDSHLPAVVTSDLSLPISSSSLTTPNCNLPKAVLTNVTAVDLPHADLTAVNLSEATPNLPQTDTASVDMADHQENINQGFQLAPPVVKK